MQKLSKFNCFLFVLFSLFTIYYSLFTASTGAQDAFPELRYPCDGDGLSPEFHSLRPYQAAFCGDANKALYCSNDLKFVETFDNFPECENQAPDVDGEDFICDVNRPIGPHTLIVELDDSMFPIMGNTEEVKNGNGGTEVFDDATKVNEYASWYLSGVNNRAEYGAGTTDQAINYSGPVQKLLPKVIQEAERIKTLDTAKTLTSFTDDITLEEVNDKPINHNQIVACSKKEWWLFGPVTPVPCYSTFMDTEYRLLEWDRTGLGVARDTTVFLGKLIGIVPGITADIVSEALASAWDNRKPPLPWDDGTEKPFESQVKYQKAYNEWQGKSCVIIPIINMLICLDLDPTDIFVNSEWAEMYNYIPLSNTTDKKGAERVMDVQPHPSGGTAIDGFSYGEVRSAPLYFAHTQEVKELSELVSKTYNPIGCTTTDGVETCEPLKNERGNSTVEKNYCSAVNIRVNKGDNLFPGDPDEIQVPEVQYTITQVKCHVNLRGDECPRNDPNCPDPQPVKNVKCHAEVTITLKTSTKTPNANEIFDQTVAGKGSIFRKIFPKVEVGAPVSCIADMPTVTDVTYTATNTLTEGDSRFDVVRFPEDGAGSNPQLTFPHVGSVYEYFLKGIQTALRPKGYGEPIVSGTLCSSLDGGDCSWNIDKINQGISAAAAKYNVPEEVLRAIFEIEMADEINDPSKYQCTTPDEWGSIGVSQVRRDLYEIIACPEEQMEDVGMCDEYNPKLSRCNFEDSFELMARALLYKASRLSNCKPTGGIDISEKMVWYNAACDYYGRHTPTERTIEYAQEIPVDQLRNGSPDQMSYCDIVCWRAGSCPPYP